MILKSLYDYADRNIGLPPVGYGEQPVRYLIEVGNEHADSPPAVIDTASEGERVQRLLLPRLDVQRSSGIKPVLLADNGEYVLAAPREGASVSVRKDAETVIEDISRRHASFLALLRVCLEQTSDEAVASVLGFYQRLGAPLRPQSPALPPAAIEPLLPADYDASSRVSFTYGGEPVAYRDKVRQFWASYSPDSSSGKSSRASWGQCMVTGEVGPVVSKMPGTIRGLPGTLPTGAKLVSFNRPSFESYGFKANENAPLSPEAARKIDAALSELLGRQELKFLCGDTTYLFWSSQASGSGPVGSALRTLIYEPSSPECLKLLQYLTHGGSGTEVGVDEEETESEVDPEDLYSLARQFVDGGDSLAESVGELNVLGLAGRSARVSIRSFAHAAVPEMLAAAGRFVLAQRMLDFDGRSGSVGTAVMPARGMAELAAATVAPGTNPFANPRTSDSLVRCATGESELSEEILQGLARRARSGAGGLSAAGAQLAKIGLVSKGVISIEDLTDTENLPEFEDYRDGEAYHLGRLLAQLETIQRLALERDVSANLATKYYGLAASAPSVGFSQPLTKVNSAHLPRLYRRRRGLFFRLKGELDDILGRISTPFPATLGLQHQLLFDLGYRHQETRNRAASMRRSRGNNSSAGVSGGDSDAAGSSEQG